MGIFNIFKKRFQDETLEEQREDIERLAPKGVEEFLMGLSCDELTDATGAFGRSVTNPIPVNGPIGEIKYLNRLKNRYGVGFLFHRLGPIESTVTEKLLDAFEVVSIDGGVWDILYFDMYHPRRTTKTPLGYHLSEYDPSLHRLPAGFGTLHRDPRFPFGISKFIERDYDIFGTGIFNKRLALKCDEFLENKNKFVRPTEHKDKVSSILWELNPIAYSQPIVDILNFELGDLNVDAKTDSTDYINRFIDSLDILIEFITNDDEYLQEHKKDVVDFMFYIKEKTIQAQTLPSVDYMKRLQKVVANLGRVGGERAGGYVEMAENEKPTLTFKTQKDMVHEDAVTKLGKVAGAVFVILDY